MTVAGRVVRRMAVRLIGGVARRARFAAVIAVLGGGYLVASALDVVPSPARLLPNLDAAGYQASGDEPVSTANYFRAQQTYDAKLMWGSYSERSTLELQRKGRSVEVDQVQLDQAKRLGTRIDQVHYIGAYPIPNGSMHFYVVAQTGRARGDVVYTPYAFTLDPSGKIEGIQ